MDPTAIIRPPEQHFRIIARPGVAAKSPARDLNRKKYP